MSRTGPRSTAALGAIAPVLAGAVATAAGVMLVGWPQRPPLPGPAGTVAAVVLVLVAVLLAFAPAVRPQPTPSGVARDRLVAAGPDPDRADRSPGQLFDPLHAGMGEGREVFEPIR